MHRQLKTESGIALVFVVDTCVVTVLLKPRNYTELLQVARMSDSAYINLDNSSSEASMMKL